MVIGLGMRGVPDTMPELAVTSGYTRGTRVQISQFWKAFGERAPPHLYLMVFGEMSAWRDWVGLYERQLTQIHVMCIHELFIGTITS